METLSQSQEVLFTPPPSLAKPVTIISPAMREWFDTAAARMDGEFAEITTDAQYKAACALLNDVGKGITGVEKTCLDYGRPFREVSDGIREKGKEVTVPMTAKKVDFGKRIRAYEIKVEQENARINAERLRLQQEAEQRKIEAAKKLDAAKSEKSFEAAAKTFGKAVEVEEQAQALAPVVAPKAKGVKLYQEVTNIKVDFTKLSLNYAVADEAKIRRHIKDGTLNKNTPGLSYEIEERLIGSGR